MLGVLVEVHDAEVAPALLEERLRDAQAVHGRGIQVVCAVSVVSSAATGSACAPERTYGGASRCRYGVQQVPARSQALAAHSMPASSLGPPRLSRAGAC